MNSTTTTLERTQTPVSYRVEPLWRYQDLKARLPVQPELDEACSEVEIADRSVVLVAYDRLVNAAVHQQVDRSRCLWSIDR